MNFNCISDRNLPQNRDDPSIEYVMFVPISLYTKISSISGISSMPVIVLVSALTDRCRTKLGTVTTRRRVHLSFSSLIIAFFIPVLIWPCNGIQNVALIGKIKFNTKRVKFKEAFQNS